MIPNAELRQLHSDTVDVAIAVELGTPHGPLFDRLALSKPSSVKDQYTKLANLSAEEFEQVVQTL